MAVNRRKIGEGKVIAWASWKQEGSKTTWKYELGSVYRGKKISVAKAKLFIKKQMEVEWKTIDSKKAQTFKFKINELAIRQGYNARMDESLGMRRGKAKSKKQSYKSRRDESKGMSKASGRRAYASVRSMDKGRRTRR